MSRCLLLVLLLLSLLSASYSQDVLPTPVLPAENSSPVAPVVSEEFASPRASLEHFLKVMNEAGPLRPDLYLLGTRHLDLSEIPAVVREERGIFLGQQLHDLLSALHLTNLTLDPAPGADEITLHRYPSGQSISLRKQPDGRWLFSSATVQAAPSLHDALVAVEPDKFAESSFFQKSYLGVSGTVWTLLLLLPVLSYLSGCLVVLVLRIFLRRLLAHRYEISIEQRQSISRPLGYLGASLVFWVGLCLLKIPTGLLLVLLGLIKVTATAAAITLAYRLSDAASSYAMSCASEGSATYDGMLVPLARRSFKVLVGMLGALFLAQNLDIEVWSLFAGFSIFGAMVALAGQDTVKNFFGSLTVLGDRPFRVGDWIVVEGIEGMVEDVGFRSTRVRTFYDSLVTLPNSRLITASVDNYGRRNYRRYNRAFMVGWNTPTESLEAFCEGIRELVRQHPYTRKDNYQVWVNDVNEYALEVLIYIFFAAPDWGTELRERHRFLLDVHRLANELGIVMAYPKQRLFLSRDEERPETDFDRTRQTQAMTRGRQVTQELLKRSLPPTRPDRHIITPSGSWVEPNVSSELPNPR